MPDAGRLRALNASLILFVKMALGRGALRSRWRNCRDEIGLRLGNGVMRNIMIAAGILIGLGTFMAQMADRMSAASASAAPKLEMATTSGLAHARSLSISRDRRGHFLTDARIEGQRVSFMVDTGASVVALNESSAARFGLRPSRGEYNATVNTANGTVKAARTRLAMLDVGGLVVRDVEAMVLPDEALSENLLGLSFLSRLRRFEYANGRMMLEQ